VSGARPRAQSKKGAELIYKYPILLDACANEMQRVGDPMMTKWAEARAPGALPQLATWRSLRWAPARLRCPSRGS